MLKRIALIVSSGLFKITLFSLALASAGWMVFGTPDKIKQAADESDIYSSAVESALDAAKKEALKSSEQLPVNDPAVQQAAQDAFPKELLTKNSESIINGFYAWLKGDTDTPQFSVDLTEAKQRFADGVGEYAQKRYEGLPPCTLAELQSMGTDIDPFEINCRLPGLLGNTVNEEVRTEILNSDQFLKDTTFTAEDLPKDEEGKAITDNLSAAPDAFSAFRLLPWILVVLSALLALAVLLFSATKRRGLRRIGTTLIGTGIFLGAGTLLIMYLFNRTQLPQDGFQASVAKAAKLLAGDYNGALMKFYVRYIVAGAIILLALWFYDRTHKNDTEAVKTENDSSNAASDEQPVEPKITTDSSEEVRPKNK